MADWPKMSARSEKEWQQMTVNNWRSFCSGCALLFATLLFLAACEPAPEERMSRAEAYVAEADYRSAVLELKNALRANPDYAAARLLFAQASYQLGDLATAEIEYERALGLGEDRLDVWTSFGRTLLEQGKAREAFERVVPELLAGDEAALILQGDILASLGNASEAKLAYLAALEINSSSPGGLIGRAVLAAGADDMEGASAFLDAAVQGNPASPLVWRAKGNYLRLQRDFAGAAEAFAQSMASETRTTPLGARFLTRVNRVSVLVDGRNYDAASAQFDELKAEFPPHPLLHYLRGRIEFGNGNYDLAQSELQEYLARVPRDARGQAILGAVNFSQDNLRQAEMYLIQAVRANVGGVSTRRLLAETQLRLNKPEDALAVLQAAQAQGESDPMLLSMLGRAEIGLGDTESAINYFEQSVAGDPGNPAIVLSLAASYIQAGRPADAIRVLESIQDVPGSLYRRETLLIGAYLSADRRDEAIQQGDELLKANSNDPAALALVGVLHNTIGNTERAAALFGQALSLDPENLGALYHLGAMAVSAGDMPVAADRFSKLLDAHPAYVPGLVSLVAVLQQQGRIGDVRPWLAAAIERAPGSIAPRVLLARVELAEGEYDTALNIVANTRQLFPEEPGLDHLEGKILLRKGMDEDAVRSFARAVARSPDNAVYHYDLAAAQLRHGDFKGAAGAARDYRALRPADIRGLSLLVDAEIRAGSPDNARADVRGFAQEYPSNAAARLLAGDIELAGDSPRAAITYYEAAARQDWTRVTAIQLARAHQAANTGKATNSLERWLSKNPQDTEIRLMNAQLLEAKGAIGRAVTEYERVHAAGKLNAVGLNNLAWQYFLRGRDDAADLARQAYELNPDNGSITDTLGWILFKGGETDRALDLLRKAAERSPDSLEIRFHLAAILAKSGDKSAAKNIIEQLLASDGDFSSRVEAEQLAKIL